MGITRFLRRFTAVSLVLAMSVNAQLLGFFGNMFTLTAMAAPSAGSQPAPGDTATGGAMALTPELKGIADGLNAAGIYDYVRNNIRHEFYYGFDKSAAETFAAKSGNDCDTAGLLIAMLRYKGVPARFVRGTAGLGLNQAQNMTGAATPEAAAQAVAAKGIPTTIVTSKGKIFSIRIERVWAEAYIPYDNYRGAGEGIGERVWIPLDAGFKLVDAAGGIIPETADFLPASLPYVLVSRGDTFSDPEAAVADSYPDITYNIPDRMSVGESFDCYVTATADNGLDSLTVSVNGGPVALDADGRFKFTAPDYGSYVFKMTAVDKTGNSKTVTHTLLVEPEADTTPPDLDVLVDYGDGKLGGTVYVHVTASDDSGSADVAVDLDGAPLSGADGTYAFTADRLGSYEILVTATDPSGNYTQKGVTYTLTGAGETPSPTFPSLDINVELGDAPGPGVPINIYTSVKDESGPVSLKATADGEELSGIDGQYQFMPDDYGTFEIVVTATNEQGNSTQRTVAVTLTEGETPKEVTFPVLDVTVEPGKGIGDPVRIHAEASDPGGESVSISVKIDGADIAGGGDYYFTPERAGSYEIITTATNQSGNSTQKTVILDVSGSGAGGAVTSASYPKLNVDFVQRTVNVGETFDINIDASDESGGVKVAATANGDSLPYYQMPDNHGVAHFTPAEPGDYAIVVTATNDSGNTAVVRFTLTAAENTEAPGLYIIVNNGQDTAKLGDTVPILVGGTGLAAGSVKLTADGAELRLNASNTASYTAAKTGLINIQATAKDNFGKDLSSKSSLKVIDPADGAVPSVSISSPANGAEITSPTDIRGTVTGTGLVYYTLSYAAAGGSDFTVIAQSGSPADNAVLGTFDPTLLKNGYYTIRLTGYGSTKYTYAETVVSVRGDMKIGNFSVDFTDMTFPVRNFPMTVSRGYDSRDRNTSGDFGYGWHMSVSSATLSVSSPLGKGWDQGVISSMFGIPRYSIYETVPHEITVDWGNGKKDAFTVKVQPGYQDLTPISYGVSLSFAAKAGTNAKLESLDYAADLYYNDGELMDLYSYTQPYTISRFKLTDQDGTAFVFGPDGNIQSITDVQGSTITVSKNGIFHSDGKTIAFTRDGKNRITKIQGPTGKTTSYTYDGNGDLSSFSDITGAVTRFEYNNSHFLTGITDPRGVNVARNEYDDSGRLTAVVDANGNRISFDSDIAGRKQAVKDRLGNTTLFVYDESGNVLSRTDACGNTTRMEYDKNGNLSSQTDALGNVTKFEYTADGKLLSKTDALGNKITNTLDSKGLVTSVSNNGVALLSIGYDAKGSPVSASGPGGSSQYAYDAKGQLTGITDSIGEYLRVSRDAAGNVVSATRGDGSTASFTYDGDGNCTSKTETRMGENGPETLTESYVYNAAGLNIKTIKADGSVVSNEYNSIGKLSAAVDEKGRRTVYSYDIYGNLERVSYSDGTFESFAYDAEGRNTDATSRSGQTVIMDYDAVGNLLKKTYANGSTETFVYDAKYRLTESTSRGGGVTRYEYDAADDNTAVIDALGGRTEYTYDSMSRITGMKDALGHTYRYEYDGNGNRTRVVMPDGTSAATLYDARNNPLRQTDPNGYETSYAYDGAGRLTGVTDAAGGVWRYGYDGVGELVSVTDALGNVTHYEYDMGGRVIKTINAAGKEATATYDASGNILTSTDFAGVVTSFNYDASDRLVRKEAGSDWVAYAYTADGKLLSATDISGATKFTYDDMDGLTRIDYPGGDYIRYTYDKAGRLTGRQTPYGGVTYGYDLLDRMVSAESAGGKTVYAYDAAGNLASAAYPNGIKQLYAYDSLNRLIREDVKNGAAGAVTFYAYTLGKNGERLKVEEPGRSVEYTYDKLYRLTGEKAVSGGVTADTRYAYDAAGNRTQKTANGAVTAYTYNSLNQLTGETGVSYAYDGAGNLISKTEAGKSTAYIYDAFNRLTSAAVTAGADTSAETYRYDYAGNRVAKTTDGVTTRYLIDPNADYAQVAAELSAGGLIAFYARGIGLVSRQAGGQTQYYVSDGHGDTRMLTDAGGGVTDTYAFDAWGNILTRTGLTDNPFLYCGEQFDAATGLYYLRARYMNPATGTFISMDTYQGSEFDPGSLHKYLYTRANPVMRKDPGGTEDFSMAGLSAGMEIMATLQRIVIPLYVPMLGLVTGGLLAEIFSASGNSSYNLGSDISSLVQSVDASMQMFKLALTVIVLTPIIVMYAENAKTSALAKSIADVVERTDIKSFRDNSVYALKTMDMGIVRYIGISNDPEARFLQHQRDPGKQDWIHTVYMTVFATGLTRREARLIEQAAISAYTLQNLNNARREIASKNVKNFIENLDAVRTLIEGAIEEGDFLDFMQ